MKFLSIFAARRDADGQTSYEEPTGDMTADNAAELFGVPESDLTPAVRAALAAMSGEITDLREQLDTLRTKLQNAENMADHDPLVPLFNRRAFMRELSRLLAFSRRYGLEASLIFFDLDGFKAVNDKHGHAAGDKVLCAVGELLIHQTRESDLLGRLGGDEFVAVLTSVSPDTAAQKAEQLANAINELEVPHEGETLHIAASFGVAPLDPNESPHIQVARADEAMYAEKMRRKANRA